MLPVDTERLTDAEQRKDAPAALAGICTFAKILMSAIHGTEPFAVYGRQHMLFFGLRPRCEALTLASTTRSLHRKHLDTYTARGFVSLGNNAFARHLAADPLFPLPARVASPFYTRMCERDRLPQAEYYALNPEDPAFPGVSTRRLKQLRGAGEALDRASLRERTARGNLTAVEEDVRACLEGRPCRGPVATFPRGRSATVASAEDSAVEETIVNGGEGGKTWAQAEMENREEIKMKPKKGKKKGKKVGKRKKR